MPITLTKHGPEVIAELKPLWIALHQHHVAVAPDLGVPRSHEDSWQRRRHVYQTWFKDPRTFVILAKDGDQAVGYAYTRFRKTDSETWHVIEELAELETLVVLPAYQGQGLGQRLVDNVVTEVKAQGCKQLGLSVIAANESSLAFYRRLGFTPREVNMRRQI